MTQMYIREGVLLSWQAIGLGGLSSCLQETDLLGPGRFLLW